MYKKFLPRSLVSRFMLIIILPTILFQCIIIYIFYERHWNNVATRTSYLIANNISVIIDVTEKGQIDLANHIATRYNILFEKSFINYRPIKNRILKKEFEFLYDELCKRFDMVRIIQKSNISEIFIQHNTHFYNFSVLNKPLTSFTTNVFMWWWLLSNLLVIVISILFARNQIKSILELARAADMFGRGMGLKSNFKPQGAKEIRAAGFAFIKMQRRLEEQIDKHTKMLAMISHDLKTPLTRLKLQVEIINEDKQTNMMKEDLNTMTQMIEHYLNFAKGQLIDEFQDIDLAIFIKEYIKHFTTTSLKISFGNLINKLVVRLSSKSFMRVLDNILSNSSKYANEVMVSVYNHLGSAYIDIEDNGPGVSKEERDLILQPFYRSDKARNLGSSSNVGLGLAIASEILKEHNGKIKVLKSNQMSGLMIRIILPLVQS